MPHHTYTFSYDTERPSRLRVRRIDQQLEDDIVVLLSPSDAAVLVRIIGEYEHMRGAP